MVIDPTNQMIPDTIALIDFAIEYESKLKKKNLQKILQTHKIHIFIHNHMKSDLWWNQRYK